MEAYLDTGIFTLPTWLKLETSRLHVGNCKSTAPLDRICCGEENVCHEELNLVLNPILRRRCQYKPPNTAVHNLCTSLRSTGMRSKPKDEMTSSTSCTHRPNPKHQFQNHLPTSRASTNKTTTPSHPPPLLPTSPKAHRPCKPPKPEQ